MKISLLLRNTFTLFLAIYLANSIIAQGCGNYRVKLTNSNPLISDGWYGNSIAIKINNTVVYPNVTLSQGQGVNDFSFAVNPDDVISILFKRNGSNADYCKYQVFDSNNNLLATRDGGGTGSWNGPENVMGILACPSGFKCGTYKVELIDFYNNGWGNSYLEVYINDSLETSGTFLNLSYAWADTEDVSFAVESGDSIDVVWVPDPTNPFFALYQYLSYRIFDINDSLIATVNAVDSTGPPGTFGLVSCPNLPPISNIAVNTTSSCSGLIQFTDMSANNPTSWFWDFGDGNTDTVQNPVHNYTTTGVYTVSLISTNSSGADTLVFNNYLSINLGANYPITPSCTPQTQDGSLGFGITNVNLANLSRSSGDAAEGYSDFTCDSTFLYLGSSYTIDVTHGFPTFHQCAAWIDFNNDGVFDNSTEQIAYSLSSLATNNNFLVPSNAVLNVPLRMRVWADYDLGSQLDPCNDPLFGQVEDYTIYILQNTAPPSADFSSDVNYTCNGEVAFTDLSSNAPYQWEWDFGDGTSSIAQFPTHIYQTVGIYDVKLITANPFGSDTLIKSSYVEVATANALISPNCSPNTLGYCCNYGINKVIFNTILNPSSGAEEGYMDFSCEYQTTVTAGNSYPLIITTGTDNPQDTKAWLDYDNNGIFDSSELLFEEYNTYNPNVSITIPTNTVYNTPLRLRISSDEVGNGFGACDDLFRGQVEDYGVIINEPALSINENVMGEFKVYPNPSNGLVTVESAKSPFSTIVIYSLLGKQIAFFDVGPIDQYTLDTKQISAGSYLIEITDDNGFRSVQTLVIQ